MKIKVLVGSLMGLGTLIGGGACAETVAKVVQPPAVVARMQGDIALDGKLDKAEWKLAPTHALSFLDSTVNLPALTRSKVLADPYEEGSVQFLLGEKFLYIGISFEDRDIVAQVAEDQAHLYSSGDVAEVFIKADHAPGYFELYASPLGNKTSFYFPSPGYAGLPVCTSDPLMEGLEVKASVQGTVNDCQDMDKGWTAEMAIPLAGLKERLGIDFAPGQAWSILVSRYNYGHTMRAKQFSSYPKLPQVNYHLIEYYSPIKIAGDH